MTEGEYRVGVTFNPSGNPKVDNIKKIAASLIDAINEELKGDALRDVGMARCLYEAMTCVETGAMWAVKGITKPKREE